MRRGERTRSGGVPKAEGDTYVTTVKKATTEERRAEAATQRRGDAKRGHRVWRRVENLDVRRSPVRWRGGSEEGESALRRDGGEPTEDSEGRREQQTRREEGRLGV
eukprot:6797491-Pyramimonas_sp.AAC.2